MKKILLLLGLLLGGVVKVEAQDTVRSFVNTVPEGIYEFETSVHLFPNMLLYIITPKEDTIVLANRTWFSKTEKSPNFLGQCVSLDINPTGRSIDSLGLFVFIKRQDEDALVWQKVLKSRGVSEVVWQSFKLPSGDVLNIREIYRRRFDCHAYIWFDLRRGQ